MIQFKTGGTLFDFEHLSKNLMLDAQQGNAHFALKGTFGCAQLHHNIGYCAGRPKSGHSPEVRPLFEQTFPYLNDVFFQNFYVFMFKR